MRTLALLFLVVLSKLNFAEGNYQAGKEKAVVCAACHGEKGISLNPEWPSLAGQHAAYLVKQLNDYKEGKVRKAATMAPMVADLNAQDMADLAEYYSKQTPPEGSTSKQYMARGEALYRGGDFNKHIMACIACHGPDGMGNGQAGFPMLSGQQAQYSLLQLQAFKSGERANDLYGIMRSISSRMSQEDMEAVAHYVSGLH